MGARKRKTDSQPSSIIDELRQAIIDSGLTQYRIAKDADVPQPCLVRFMNGTRGISLETAAKLAAYLQLRLTRIQ